MKSKTLYWTLGIVGALLVIGYFTNWFGMKKPNGAVSNNGTGRVLNGNGNLNINPPVKSCGINTGVGMPAVAVYSSSI